MQRITDWTGLTPDMRGATVAMGNFDGLHLGHQAVIAQARAAVPDAPCGVITFEPHPREFFGRLHGIDIPPFRLMNAEARANRLRRMGLDRLYELPFTTALASMDADDFAREVLAGGPEGGLGVRHVTVGADFRYGKGRGGDAETLRAAGARYGFGVTIADLVDIGGLEISSTAIRTALSEGRTRDAQAMLGHWHRIDGEVVHGEKRGRELGYPTANMAVDGLHLPRLGVYAVKVDVLNGPHAGTYDAAASLGVRPMFGENTPNLESFLFDFSGDLYGAHLSVAFIEFLRPELKFDGLPALLQQMSDDCARARGILGAL